MHKFRQFMGVEEFTKLTQKAMSTHMYKPEVVSIMRALATKYSDLGDHEKALEYVTRAEKLSAKYLPTTEHQLVLLLWLTKVEIYLKKLQNVNES